MMAATAVRRRDRLGGLVHEYSEAAASGFLNPDMERLVKAMVLPGRWHGFETGERLR
jgi:hypothetical protein